MGTFDVRLLVKSDFSSVSIGLHFWYCGSSSSVGKSIGFLFMFGKYDLMFVLIPFSEWKLKLKEFPPSPKERQDKDDNWKSEDLAVIELESRQNHSIFLIEAYPICLN